MICFVKTGVSTKCTRQKLRHWRILSRLPDENLRARRALGVPIVPMGRVGSPQRTQASGAQRRLRGGRQFFRVRCVVLQKRHKGGSAAKVGRLGDPSLPLIFERHPRATRALGVPIVPIGRVGSPQRTQTSGAKRRLPHECRSFQVRYVVSQARPSRKSRTPTARHPYPLFSMGPAAQL